MLGVAHSAIDWYKSRNIMPKYVIRRRSKTRRHSRLPSNLQKRSRNAHWGRKTPSTLQIPKQSQGNRYWPRLSFSGPVGRSKAVKLTYTSDQITLNCSTGGVVGASRDFALNGLFDPDVTGVGHQPMGFDQWTAFYNLYKVYKVDVKIRPIATSNTPSATFLAAQVNASQDSTAVAGATYSACGERRNCAVRLISGGYPGINVDDIIFRTFWINEIEGHNINDDNYGAAVTGDPGNKCLLKLGCGNASATDTGSLDVIVELVYHAVFYNLKSLNQS